MTQRDATFRPSRAGRADKTRQFWKPLAPGVSAGPTRESSGPLCATERLEMWPGPSVLLFVYAGALRSKKDSGRATDKQERRRGTAADKRNVRNAFGRGGPRYRLLSRVKCAAAQDVLDENRSLLPWRSLQMPRSARSSTLFQDHSWDQSGRRPSVIISVPSRGFDDPDFAESDELG
ncbi:hypothetical protein AGIG_G24203 [Arapaima gigas]